ncbi:mycofactocin system heme/flavin oxidoreductase MftD [Seminavis robusta]|uniref:Mycofactocin system heme/flavin oxidoreductase MftD n=1 Tax=Seminavis robusta TaxID=568900 RepID=A0A9N8HGD3_9STRA|nr:mycofactocin system heme/flavin oxidoreductase MftD [Seminavis robusta]|eukprot:Sro503_g155860.1 mycofactocin system heme/flavin oxidoreductase MftD (508) ;mRNA; f:51701-53224
MTSTGGTSNTSSSNNDDVKEVIPMRHEVYTNDKPPTLTGTSSTTTSVATFVPRRCTASELKSLSNILELQSWATAHSMAPSLAAFVNYGSEDEESLRANRNGFSQYSLRPRVLCNVSRVDTTTTILQGRISLSAPIGIAPFAGCRAVHPEGEIAIAKAAAQAGIVYTVPNWAATPLTDILDNSTCSSNDTSSSLLFQIYAHKPKFPNREGFDRAHMAALLDYLAHPHSEQQQRTSNSTKSKIVGVVLTCDTVNNGNREKTYKNPTWVANLTRETGGGFPAPCALQDANRLPPVAQQGHAASMTWDDIRFLKQECHKHHLALVLKGIMSGDDAVLAAQIGVNAICVSNHGGRQLDGTQSTIQALEECAAAVQDFYTNKNSNNTNRMEIFVDGGIRRGKDVAKCLALGAKCVFVGRPVLWGLALAGQDGVARALNILQEELTTVLQLMGCRTPQQLTRQHVVAREDEQRIITSTIHNTPVRETGSECWWAVTISVAVAAFVLGRYTQRV